MAFLIFALKSMPSLFTMPDGRYRNIGIIGGLSIGCKGFQVRRRWETRDRIVDFERSHREAGNISDQTENRDTIVRIKPESDVQNCFSCPGKKVPLGH